MLKTTTLIEMEQQQLLSLLYLTSPALPIGAFSYSGGLESAITLGWIKDEKDLEEWVTGIVHQGFACLDLPIFLRLHEAWERNDQEAILRWDRHLRASRESHELLFEDEQLAGGLRRVLAAHNRMPEWLPKPPSFLTVYAVAAHSFGLAAHPAALGWLWSWVENQVAIACKVIPLGQSKGQQVLLALMPGLEQALQRAERIRDEEIGATLPSLGLASAWHETQYTRLFRS
jgi:urease accessory protein